MQVPKPKVIVNTSEVLQLTELEVLLRAAQERIHRKVYAFVREFGGFSHAGLHCYNQQTQDTAYRTDMVAQALGELILGGRNEGISRSDMITVRQQLEKMLEQILDLVLNKTLKGKLIERGEMSPYIQAYLGRKDVDPDGQGGVIPYYGDASVEYRTSPPLPGQHWIVGPGEKPMQKRPMKADDEAQSKPEEA